MKRGELYRVSQPRSGDPRKARVFVIVSRQVLIESRFSTLTCAPVYSRHDDLSTQVAVGVDEGLKRESSIHCDELVSLPKPMLTHYVGILSEQKVDELNQALGVALDIWCNSLADFKLR